MSEIINDAIQPIVISADAWRNGQRPDGYQSTTSIIKDAHSRGLHFTDLIGADAVSQWNWLTTKAQKEGLTQTEAEELNKLSAKIIEAADSNLKK